MTPADLHVRKASLRRVRFCPTFEAQAAGTGIRYNRRTLVDERVSPGSVRDRLLAALADPEVAGKAGRTPAAVVAFHEPIAVFEWLGTGKGLVLLDGTSISSDELPVHLDRVLGAHEKGLLFVAVVGNQADITRALKEADQRARNRDQLGLYQIDETGRAVRVAGRRLPELEKACRELPPNLPCHPATSKPSSNVVARSAPMPWNSCKARLAAFLTLPSASSPFVYCCLP